MFIKMYKTYIKQYRQEPDKRSLYIQCLQTRARFINSKKPDFCNYVGHCL